jgi:hypothetical protein
LARSRRLGVVMGQADSAAPGGLRAAYCPIRSRRCLAIDSNAGI